MEFKDWTEQDFIKNQDILQDIFEAPARDEYNRVLSEIAALIPLVDKVYVPATITDPGLYPTYYDFLSTKPGVGQLIRFALDEANKGVGLPSLVEILVYILTSVVLKRNPTQPFQLSTKWVDNSSIRKKCVRSTVGFSFGGGGHAAEAIACGILSGLHSYPAGSLLTDKHIDYLVFVSGSAWAGGPLSFLRYDKNNRLVSSNSSVDTLLGPYIPPESLTVRDLLFAKPKSSLINNAADTVYVVKLVLYFLTNLLNPDVPLKFVLSNTFASSSLKQFDLYSERSIMQKNAAGVYEILSRENNSGLAEKIDSYYVLRPDFPDSFTTVMGSWPSKPANGEYNYYQVNVNADSYGAIAKDATLADPKDPANTIHLGQRIENLAFGSKLNKVVAGKDIVVDVEGPQYLASLNQMVGLASCAFAPAFNFSSNPLLHALNTKYVINSEVTNPNQDSYLSDGGQYDNSGVLSLIQLRTENIFAVISAGEQIIYDPSDPAASKFPKQLTDPFALSRGTEKRNLSAVLDPADFIPTVEGILASPSGVFTKEYKTLTSAINGSEAPRYNVRITWIYINITLWQQAIRNPVLKFLVKYIPFFPYQTSIFQRVNLLPVTANAFNSSMSYISANYIAPIVAAIDRTNTCPVPPGPEPPKPRPCPCRPSLLRKRNKCHC